MSDDDCEDETLAEGGAPVVLIMGVCTVVALIAFIIAYMLYGRSSSGAAGDSRARAPPAVLKRCNCRRCRVAVKNKPPPTTLLPTNDQLDDSPEEKTASARSSDTTQEVVPEPSATDNAQEEEEQELVEEVSEEDSEVVAEE